MISILLGIGDIESSSPLLISPAMFITLSVAAVACKLWKTVSSLTSAHLSLARFVASSSCSILLVHNSSLHSHPTQCCPSFRQEHVLEEQFPLHQQDKITARILFSTLTISCVSSSIIVPSLAYPYFSLVPPTALGEKSSVEELLQYILEIKDALLECSTKWATGGTSYLAVVALSAM